MVNAFKIGPLSCDSYYKPWYMDLHSHTYRVKEKRRYITQLCYNKATIYGKEVQNHLSKISVDNNVKENWKHLKHVIFKVVYQYFQMSIGGHKRSRFPYNSWFDEECKVATVKSSDVWTDIGKEYNNILYREENKII